MAYNEKKKYFSYIFHKQLTNTIVYKLTCYIKILQISLLSNGLYFHIYIYVYLALKLDKAFG